MDQNQHVYLCVKVWAEKINLSHVVVFGVTVILFWITYPRVRYPKENDWWWWFIFKQDFSTMCIEKWCYRLLLPSDDMIWTDIADRVWHHKKHISLNLKTRQTLWTVSVYSIMETNESNMYIPSETKILCLVFQYTYSIHPYI